MEDCFDFYGNPFEDRNVYKSPDEEIYILRKEGGKLIAKNPFQKKSKEVTPEFAEFLIKIGSTGFAKFITPKLERLAKNKIFS